MSDDTEKPSYYAVIPSDVRYDKRLSPNAKLLYGEITSLSNKMGCCWASNSYFAGIYEVSKRTITEWIGQLVKFGYLQMEITYREDKDKKTSKEIDKRILILPSAVRVMPAKEKHKITPTPQEKIHHTPMEENFHTPIEENFQDNILLSSLNNNLNKNLDSIETPQKPGAATSLPRIPRTTPLSDAQLKRKPRERQVSIPTPTLEEVQTAFNELGKPHLAKPFHEYYAVADWRDSTGKKVRNWRQKTVMWAKDDNPRGRSGTREIPLKSKIITEENSEEARNGFLEAGLIDE